MTIARIRDTMQFEESYHATANGMNLELRIYATKRPGMYGYQFAAIAWINGDGYASDKTTGCGYDKISTAVADVLHKACTETARGYSAERIDKIRRYSGTGQIRECIAEFLGVDYSDWRGFSEWCDANLYHAHG